MQADKITLWIGPWYSQCGACGKNADPYEDSHINETMAGEGCGAVYTNVATQYIGALEERVKQMRPDLVFDEYLDDPVGGIAE